MMKSLFVTGALQKINTVKALMVFAMLSGVLFACKKDAGGEVSVEIQSPADGAVYQSGDTIQLKVYARDNADLHEMSLEIKQGANILLGMYPYVHATLVHTVDTPIILPVVASATQLLMDANARDHDGNSAQDVISITINP